MDDTTGSLPGCKECGQPLVRKSRGPAPTYCSAACRAKAGARRAKADGRYQKRLATARAKNQAEREANAKPCPCCGDPMLNPRRVQCGKPECKRLYTNERARKFHTRWKAEHGERYNSRWNQQQSERTKRQRAQRRALGLPSTRQLRKANYAKSDAKRRMLKAKATLETFDPREVFERDRWVCQICKRKVDPSIKWPDPMSPSLDHIVPLSAGGPHSRANCRLAHLSCNSARGNRGGGEQLLLFG